MILAFDIPANVPRAHLEKRIPVEAEGRDADGMGIHFLLHVVDGLLKEIEIFREDSQPIKRLPNAEQLALITN